MKSQKLGLLRDLAVSAKTDAGAFCLEDERPDRDKPIQYKSKELQTMRSIKILGLCFIASMALSAVVSASASATKNPRWVICAKVTSGQWSNGTCKTPQAGGTHETKELKANETREISVEQVGVQKLSTPSAKTTIECQKLKVKSGAILIGGETGTDAETLVYEECSVEGHAKCKINKEKGGTAKIETKPLSSTLGYKSKAAEEAENQKETVTVVKPASGSEFVSLELEKEAGGECPLASIEGKPLPVVGEVGCENVGGNENAESHELNCPETRIAEYWLQVGGVATEKTISKLTLGGLGSSYVGKSKIKLAGIEAGQQWWIV